MSIKPCTEERVPKQIIENQLLVALDDKSKVAILASKEDLDILICALFLAESNRMAMPLKYKEMRLDLEKLKKAAFDF